MARLEVLRAYVRLVEVGSFSQVARELRVQQSTVSKWLAELEAGVSGGRVPLIQRTTRQQRVTDAGQRFYDRAREIIDLYDAAVGEVQQQALQVQGRLRVSVPGVFGHRHVLPHLPAFLAAHPALEVEVHFSERYINLVEEAVDVAIRVGMPVDSTFVGRRLGGTPRRLVAALAYLDRAGPIEAPGDLAAQDCLLHTGLRGTTWTLRQGEQIERILVKGRFAADSSEALRVLAEAGQGVALLAAWLVDDAVAAGRLRVLLPAWSLLPAPIRAVTPPGRSVPPRVRALVAHLQACWAVSAPMLVAPPPATG